MFVKYGGYTVPSGQAWVAFTKSPKFNEGGQQFAETHRWAITGLLINSGADSYAFTTQINALISAFSTNNKDLFLLQNDGVTQTAHSILTANTIGGTRVVEKTFPDAKGGAYVTNYVWGVVVEADILTGYTGLQSFFERVQWVGGGPKFVMLQTLNGPSQKQWVQDQTPYKAMQTGRAIGFTSYPVPPSPLWPYALHQDESPFEMSSPKRTGPPGNATYTDWEISWTYNHEDAAPLAGFPNIWTP